MWAAALCSGAGAMQHTSCTASLSLQNTPAASGSVPCRYVPHLLFCSSALWDLSLPLSYFDTLHRFSLTAKAAVSPGFYFNILCWVYLRTESQMRWGLRFLLGGQEVGNSAPPWSWPLAKFLSAPFTSQAKPRFLLCYLCAGTCTRETLLWTNPAKQPGGS